MTETAVTETPSKAEERTTSENPAVAHCMKAWERVYDETPKKGRDVYDAEKKANEIYRESMPTLSGIENIRDFIACVAFGMLVDAITDERGTKLLYAAQVALTAAAKNPQPKKLASV
jgi:hypothetical protein